MGVSASLKISGIKPKSEQHDKMYSVYMNCIEMKIAPPKEILEYFDMECYGDKEVDKNGVIVDYFDESWEHYGSENRENIDGFEYFQEEYCGSGEFGYVIDISKLPEDIKYLKCSLYYG